MSDIYTEHYITMNHDTDAKGIVRPSCIQRYMQETANHQMRDCKPTYEELFNEGKSFILSRMTVQCHRPLKQYEKLDVQTWPSSKDKGVAFTRCYAIYTDGEELARGLAVWALVDVETKRLLRVSECDLSNYTHKEPFEMKGLRFRLPEEMTEVGTYDVAYSLCDCNMHMNNTNYLDMFFNFVPDVNELYVSDHSITYKKEARLGASLLIKRSRPTENEDGSITYYFSSHIGEEANAECMMTLKKVAD